MHQGIGQQFFFYGFQWNFRFGRGIETIFFLNFFRFLIIKENVLS